MKRIFAGIIATLVTAIALAIPTPANAATACGNYLETFNSNHITDGLGTWYYAQSYTKRGPNTCGNNVYASNCLSHVGNSYSARVFWIAPGGSTHRTLSVALTCNSSRGSSSHTLLNKNGESIVSGSLVRIEINSVNGNIVTCHLWA